MSTPEMPMMAVKSPYSIKSCPLSSEMNCAASTLANRDELDFDIGFFRCAIREIG